jgi:hypothetical protein
MRYRTTALAALVLLTGVSSAQTATPLLNVRGAVLRGPIATPTACANDDPCDPPVTVTALFFRRAGHALVRTTVRSNGSFALHLAPGAYTLGSAPAVTTASRLSPGVIRVPATGVLHVVVHVFPNAAARYP